MATIGGQSLGWEGSVGGSGSDGVKVGTVSIGMVDEVEVEVVDVVSSLRVVVGPEVVGGGGASSAVVEVVVASPSTGPRSPVAAGA